MDPALIKKLLIKPGYRVLILNAPEGYVERISPLPEDAALAEEGSGPCDFVQLFCKDKASVDTLAPEAIAAVKPGGVLWLCYPKRGPKVQTDINRDTGWEAVVRAGWGPVMQIAIDDVWSALRFRPEADIRRTSGRWA